MSRHRFVRNLDLDGNYIHPSTYHPRSPSTEERDDGALSDGGDDMTPEEHGMPPIFFRTALLHQTSCLSRLQLN